MTQPILNRPRVVAGVGQRVAARVAQHVRTGKANPARAPMRLTSLLIASGVNGPPRSIVNTKAESRDCRRQISNFLIRGQYLVRRNGIAIMVENECADGG
jgi:hypothetical protein